MFVLDHPAHDAHGGVFGGDNNLSKYVNEDLEELMAGNRGPIAALALVDRLGAGGSQVVWRLAPGLINSRDTSVATGDGTEAGGDPYTNHAASPRGTKNRGRFPKFFTVAASR